jgi:hypothetical protein
MSATINYNNKQFRLLVNSANGELTDDMVFTYKQTGNILTCSYSGEKVLKGHLIGLVSPDGVIEMRYHQVNQKEEIHTGICTSIPEILPNGKIKLYENWQWTSGDRSSGTTTLIEC